MTEGYLIVGVMKTNQHAWDVDTKKTAQLNISSRMCGEELDTPSEMQASMHNMDKCLTLN